MMRRIVDSCIPLAFAIALIPPVFGWLNIPDSAFRFLGEHIGRVWAIGVAGSFMIVTVGVWLRKRWPATAIWVESSSLGMAGATSALYVIALWWAIGKDAWPWAWFMTGISLYCIARLAELLWALHTAVVADRVARTLAAETT